jgi:hypothetical protein
MNDNKSAAEPRLSRDVRFEIRRFMGELVGPVRLLRQLSALTVTNMESAEIVLTVIDGFVTSERAHELAQMAAKGEFGEIEKERLKAVLSIIRNEIAGTLSRNAKKMEVVCTEFEAEYLGDA